MLRPTLMLSTLLVATPLSADWTLVNDHSRLSFVSTKAGTVAEVHHFRQLEGWLGDDGRLRIAIDLASVETAIPIRNERMQELLFNTAEFPTATISAQVDLAPLRALAIGAQTELVAEAELSVLNQATTLTVQVALARLDADTLLVASAQPLVVDANQLGLGAGVEKLREIAGLPSISPAVPVSFRLTFSEDGPPASAVSQN